MNNQRAAEVARTIGEADVLHGRYVLLRKGKRSYAVLELA